MKKDQPEVPYVYRGSDLEKSRRSRARLVGLLSRIHMNLRLVGEAFEDRIKALEKWCEAREKERQTEAGQK